MTIIWCNDVYIYIYFADFSQRPAQLKFMTGQQVTGEILMFLVVWGLFSIEFSFRIGDVYIVHGKIFHFWWLFHFSRIFHVPLLFVKLPVWHGWAHISWYLQITWNWSIALCAKGAWEWRFANKNSSQAALPIHPRPARFIGCKRSELSKRSLPRVIPSYSGFGFVLFWEYFFRSLWLIYYRSDTKKNGSSMLTAKFYHNCSCDGWVSVMIRKQTIAVTPHPP